MKIASSQVSLSSDVSKFSIYQKRIIFNQDTSKTGTTADTSDKKLTSPDKDVQDGTKKGTSFSDIQRMTEEAFNALDKKSGTDSATGGSSIGSISLSDTALTSLKLLLNLLRSIGGGKRSLSQLEKIFDDDDDSLFPYLGTDSSGFSYLGENDNSLFSDMYSNLNSAYSDIEDSENKTMYNITEFKAESTSVTFQGNGTAYTEDGRTLDFNVELNMTSTFAQAASIDIKAPSLRLCDPLVINVGSDVTSVSDKKFSFDLNNDGEMDNISMLQNGSGFLSYDKNGNGKIDNGSELFGTSSGNGFKDLAKLDSDRNGWIDENDDAWSKLSVWMKSTDGKDTLMSLKDADIGAICLGSANTPFEFRSDSNEKAVNAFSRSTGVFLKESGGSGILQHVDFTM
jgi:hypothetical protein